MTDQLIIHTDGGARGNPGPAAVGVVVEQEGKTIHKFGKKIGESTNNVAEYTAVIEAFIYLLSQKMTGGKINFFLDSKLVVEQLSGRFKIKNAKLRELFLRIKMLEQEVGGETTYHRVPREQNERADFLVNDALDS